MSEKALQVELSRRLGEIQAQVLGGRLDAEDADRMVRRVHTEFRSRLARGRARPARRFTVRMLLAGTCFLVSWWAAAQGASKTVPPGAARAAVLVTGLLLALLVLAETRRLRARLGQTLGAQVSRRILDGSVFDAEAAPRPASIAAIRVKNVATAGGALTDEARASLVGAVVDLVHAAAPDPFLLWPAGPDTFVAVFEGDGSRPLEAAVRTSAEVLSRLAATGSKLAGHDASVQLGIGLHHGEVVTGLVGGQAGQTLVVLGRALDHALELADGAGWGEILVDDSTLASIPIPVTSSSREPLRSTALDAIVRVHALAPCLAKGGPA